MSLLTLPFAQLLCMYGSGYWNSTKGEEQKLHTTEMNMLIWFIGLMRLDFDIWVLERHWMSHRYNKIWESKLRWYGHIERRDRESVVIRALDLEVEGLRQRRRLRTRWIYWVRSRKKMNIIDDDALDKTKWSIHIIPE